MKNSIKLFVLVLLIISLWWVVQGRPNKIAEGGLAPDFSLKNAEGQIISLSSFKGKVVLLNFWATTCPPCVSEMESLEKLSKKFPSDKFEVLGVSLDEQGWEAISKFKQKVPVSFKIVLDSDYKVADLYGTYRIPESYFIDRNGKIAEKILGAHDWTEDIFSKKISDLIGNP